MIELDLIVLWCKGVGVIKLDLVRRVLEKT